MFCPNCGKEIEDGAKFCSECGAAIEASAKFRSPKLRACLTRRNRAYIQKEKIFKLDYDGQRDSYSREVRRRESHDRGEQHEVYGRG